MKDKLWLHRGLLDRVLAEGREVDFGEVLEQDGSVSDDEPLSYWFEASQKLPNAHVFDCRQLPDALMADTGYSVMDEPPEVRSPVRLPFDCCYFETSESGILAYEHNGVVMIGFANVGGDVSLFAGCFGASSPYDLSLLASEPVVNWLVEGEKERAFNVVTAIGGELLGVLELMKEKLIDSTFVPDPAPRLTRARQKAGKPPVTGDARVLTLNVPAVRRAVAGAPKSTGLHHESPCLHWRRGHWRVMHRGSEFEKDSWVRKCLVGDPDKGFVANAYRLRHRLPMLVNDNMPPVAPPLGADR